MRILILLTYAILFLFSLSVYCQSKQPKVIKFPDGIKVEIKNFLSYEPLEPRAAIYKGIYKKQVVYWIPRPWCCDQISSLYTKKGKVICRSGGIAGFRECPDVEKEVKGLKVIWVDNRK